MSTVVDISALMVNHTFITSVTHIIGLSNVNIIVIYMLLVIRCQHFRLRKERIELFTRYLVTI